MEKEKIGKPIGAANATLGSMSIISSYNVCHTACTSIIALLSFFGVAVAGMPLAFLIPYQIYFWIFGIVILAIALILYKIKGPCISKHMIVANSGLLLAGAPFLQNYAKVVWAVGGFIIAAAIALWVNERWMKRKS